MLEQSLLQPPSNARFAPGNGKRALFVPHAPTQNHLLAALPPEDYEHLLPDLEAVPLPQGWAIHRAGDAENYLYFLTAGVVSRFYVTEDGESAEFAVTGREGVIGVASFLGGKSTTSQAVVLNAGYAYRMTADRLRNEFEHDGNLLRLLLRYTLTLIAQFGQTAACNRHHMLEQRLCRWILSCLDRLPANELTVTQELMANLLGVRREGVTQAARNLQVAGLIDYRRGRIAVLDRRGLEAQVCECYAVVKREHDRLLADFRKYAMGRSAMGAFGRSARLVA
jgi:CRP-like cAMP-binding protein